MQCRNSGTWPNKHSDLEIRPYCLRNVGGLLTAAVVDDRAVFAPTLELEQTSIKELRFYRIDIGPFLGLQLVWGHVFQAKQEGGAP